MIYLVILRSITQKNWYKIKKKYCIIKDGCIIMKEHFYSYLDGFNRVTVIYPKEHLTNVNSKKFYVLIEENAIELSIKD